MCETVRPKLTEEERLKLRKSQLDSYMRTKPELRRKRRLEMIKMAVESFKKESQCH